MRFEKGSIQVSDTRDIPLLQQVLRAGFITSGQLFEFMTLQYAENRREAFDHRLRRLMHHGLIERVRGFARGRPQVCRISAEGVSLLIDHGELFSGRTGVDGVRESCTHWLELNDLHLSLLRARILTRWIPATEICSQNDLTQFQYAKDYDAVAVLDVDGVDLRFAIEYERVPKTQARYEAIARSLEYEQLVDAVLYVVPNFHLLCKIRDYLAPRGTQVCVALYGEFTKALLATPVTLAGSERRDVPFERALLDAHARRKRRPC
jgi:hypothetical protein